LFISPILSTSSIVSNAFKNTQSGSGTYYGTTTGGNCGYGSLYPSFASSLTKVALGTAMYQGNDGISGGCGLCISMQGTGSGSGAKPISKTPFTVFAHDQCPGCAATDLDLSISGDGRWGITWKAVPCPIGSEKLRYKFQGSNPYYLKLQVVGHKLPLAKLEYVIGGVAHAATRSQDNFWVYSPSGAVTFPLTVNIYATDGEKLTDKIGALTNDVLLTSSSGGVQFTGNSGLEADQSAVGGGNLDVNVVIGIAVGCVVLAVVIIVIIVVVVKRRRQEENVEIA